MKTFTLVLLAGAGMLASGSAFAAGPLLPAAQAGAANTATQARMVCDEDGRCYRVRGQRRVVVEDDSYGYAPRERYVDRRGYYDQGPSVGIGVAPGVGVGIGFGGGRDRW